MMGLEGLVDYLLGVAGDNRYVLALIGGGICFLLTFIGALPALLGTMISQKMLDIGLGFSAGIMIVAGFTSLILPGIELGGVFSVVAGFILGSFIVALANKLLPHEHFVKGFEGPESLKRRMKAVWLLVIAIIIHNFPEGLAVGSGIAYNPRDGLLLAFAIGLQDMPEGFAVAAPLVGMGMPRVRALSIAFLSGAVELFMAVIPVALTDMAYSVLPYMLGFAGGAMIYVVSSEVIPETHRHGHEDWASVGFIIGFIIMLILDTVLG